MEEKKEKRRVESSYFKHGLMIFITGCFLILFYYIVNHGESFSDGLSKFLGIFRPFVIGAIIAYLVCPIYNFFVRIIYKPALKRGKLKKPLKVARTISTVITLAIFIGLVTGFIMLLIPGIIESVANLIPKVQPAFNDLSLWVQEKLAQNDELADLLSGRLDNISENLISWAQNKFLPQAKDLMQSLTSTLVGTLNVVIDLFIAIVVCIYSLNSKDLFLAQTKKLILSSFREERANKIFEFGSLVDQNFGGFINGKIIDSIIIGIICAVAMAIMGCPLIPLVSVIVGVTNIIPFFGPFIGAIPSALLLLMINPMACLKFIIMILILQQLDGNVIGPKILGKTTKLSSFWVLFSIVVGGGLFGFVGMIVSVPLFAVIYTYIARAVNNGLKKKELEVKTSSYEDFSTYLENPKAKQKKESKLLKILKREKKKDGK